MPLTAMTTWSRAFALALPVLAAQALAPTVLDKIGVQVNVGTAFAQEGEQQKPKEEVRRTQALNNKVYEKLQAAQTAVEEKNFPEAIKVLDDLQKSRDLNDYELANVLNVYAFVYYSQENFPKALDAYKKITTLSEAPAGTITQARYSLAQLYFVTEQYKEGVDALLAWFKESPNAGANAYMLLAQGYYQLKKNSLALTNVEKAISMYEEKGKLPKENWFGLQRFLYYDKGNYKKVVEILDKLLTHYPKKNYWVQLSAMHGELKDEVKQLGAMETAYVQGMLTEEKELVNLAYLYLANDVPYRAAKVLDTGIKAEVVEPSSKNLELLGNAWRASQEVKKAIPEMAKAAAKSDKGDLWARLCNIYLDNDEYTKAIDACNKGLKKGGVKREDTAYLVKGMAHFNLKQYKSARTAFNKAAKDKRSEKYAKQWIKFMDKELERQKSLEQA